MPDERISPAQRSTGDMAHEEFRAAAHKVADQVAGYLAKLETYDVLPRIVPGEIRARLAATPPEQPEPFDEILRDYAETIEPNITHWQHPGFMAYFPSVATGPGILGEWLATGLNSNVMFWRNAPASTELEQLVVDWVRQMLGLPQGFDGMFTDTASISSLLSLVAARHAVEGLDSREEGLCGRPGVGPLRVYISDQAHMSIDKAAIVIGVGRNGIRRIPVDAAFRLQPQALAEAIAEDRAAGRTPMAVVATLGTTSTTSVDPIAAIAEICKREKIWLHIDAAYAGAAATLPEMQHHFAGWEHADSIVFNPHKWFFTAFDASMLFFRDPHAFRDAFSLVPEYIKTDVAEEARNYNEFGIQLGRRFRALKMWMHIRWFGVAGIRARLREHCAWAQRVAGWIDAEEGWERLAPVPFSTICFRYRPRGENDEVALRRKNERILERINSGGNFFLSHTVLDGRFTLRVALGNPRASDAHIKGVWGELQAAAAESIDSQE